MIKNYVVNHMRESKYVPVILDSLENGAVSIKTLKEKCGQGNKITNIRKALHQLLRNQAIEINGYDSGCKTFNYDCIMVKKVETNVNNPIYVKGLLDNPLLDENYFKIRELFKKRIETINQIYYRELEELNEIQGKMPFKEAIDKGYVRSERYHHTEGPPDGIKKVTHGEILKKRPDAQVFFLKRRFDSQIANIMRPYKEDYPYFGNKARIKTSDRRIRGTGIPNQGFLNSYKNHLSHLPINEFWEKELFEYFVIGALRVKDETREDRLWGLAITLTEDFVSFVEKLEVVDFLSERMFDDGGPMLSW